jgi:pSer/pThr/pTyr-binding forkhead associated (FHA) protein
MVGGAFLFRNGPHSGKRLTISNNPFLIGRSETCDLRIDSAQVSRLHCELRHEPCGTFVVCDLGSRNGTFVNGQRIDSAVTLTDGDQIRVGNVELEYLADRFSERPGDTSDGGDTMSEGSTRIVDPTKLTLDELVKFDDDPLELESDASNGNSVPLFESNVAGPNPPTTDQSTPPPVASAMPLTPPKSKGDESTRHAAKEALKQLFRGRNSGRHD